MGYAQNDSIVKAHHEASLETNVSLDLDVEDSFLDSILNFDGWVEDHPNPSLAEVMNSEGKPDSENVNSLEIKNEKEEVCEYEELGCLIQEGIGKVCLTSGDGNDIGKETKNLEVDESSSSGSSDDDGDDSDEGGLQMVKDEADMEEGEIRDEMLAWSDYDDDDDVVKGPIRSRNEVKDLPPVPPVTVTIQPHHQTLPVGVVLSIMSSQVIVEGLEEHKPLSEGSILWVTESRTPLGVVDEIFGPVKNPYYIVRYNSETEIPTGIQQGSLISFVPEFADYVLNNNSLFKKGYDASGENDEECSEELEFSDDEKEAEYKRMLKMSKRGSSGEKNTRMKKDKKSRNRGGKLKNDHQPSASSQSNISSSGPQAFSQAPNTMSSGVLPQGFPSIRSQNMGFPANGFPSNVPPFMQQNFIPQPFQNMGLLNLAPTPFGPQFNTAHCQMFPHNFAQGGFGAFASWPLGMPQNNFNQLQPGPPMMFQGLTLGPAMPNGLQMENNGAVRPFVGGEACQNPNQGGTFSNHGGTQWRKPSPGGRGQPRFRLDGVEIHTSV
ncbi:hypothetical protein R6Q59_012662 [Mikania micrantha]